MFTPKRTLVASLCALALSAAPVLAQQGGGMQDHGDMHGGMHDGMGEGHMGMADMHTGEMMQQMNVMLGQMSEMMQQMHGEQGAQGAMNGHMHDQMTSGAMNAHNEMWQQMNGDMGTMLQTMRSLHDHMQQYMSENQGGGDTVMNEHMDAMVKNLDTMVASGHAMMKNLAEVQGQAPDSAPVQAGHAGHDGHDAH